MKWKIRSKRPPAHRDQRFRKIFAWKPEIVGTHKVWLERYEVIEEYFQPSNGAPGWWRELSRHTLSLYWY